MLQSAPIHRSIPTFGLQKSKISRAHNWLLHHYLWKETEELVNVLKGIVLDIGCGVKPYKSLIEQNCVHYFGLEHSINNKGYGEVDIVGDALLLPFANESVDCVLLFQVLEHVPEPAKTLKEIYRVLKKDGIILITTPFIWGEHEQPYDYYRYTRYGLKHLLLQSGFEVKIVKPYASYWPTAVIRFNYWALSFAVGPFKLPLVTLLWLNQFIVLWMCQLASLIKIEGFTTYNYDFAGFITVGSKN